MNAHVRDGTVRNDWTREDIAHLFALPFNDLVWRAQSVHRAHFDANEVQISTLLSIKTGGCPEDCAYCPQSAAYETGVKAGKLMDVSAVLADATAAREAGATRFCMGAAWRQPKDRDLDAVCQMVEGVKALGLETCVTLGMLTGPQAERLKGAGLDYYNHNLDTSPEYYGEIISTRTYQERLGHAGACARRGHPCVLRRDRRHGRRPRGSRRHDPCARHPAPASGKRADQRAGAGRRHAGQHWTRGRRHRIRAHHRGRAPHHAEIDGAAVGGPRDDERGVAGAVVSSPAPTRSSTAPSFSPPPTRRRNATARCSTGWG